MTEVGIAIIGLGGVALGSVASLLQQRLALMEARRHETSVRWHQSRLETYVELVTTNDELYRAVDKLNDDLQAGKSIDTQADVALKVWDRLVRTYIKVTLLRRDPEIQRSADELLETCRALYRLVKGSESPPPDVNAVEEFTNRNARRVTAVSVFLEAASRELDTR